MLIWIGLIASLNIIFKFVEHIMMVRKNLQKPLYKAMVKYSLIILHSYFLGKSNFWWRFLFDSLVLCQLSRCINLLALFLYLIRLFFLLRFIILLWFWIYINFIVKTLKLSNLLVIALITFLIKLYY